MNTNEFRTAAHELVDWMADYMDNVSGYPVKSNIQPGEIKVQLPKSAPAMSEGFKSIFSNLKTFYCPG